MPWCPRQPGRCATSTSSTSTSITTLIPHYTWLRENRPIFWDEAHQLWVLSRHADVNYVSTHPDLFCSARGIRPTQSADLSLVSLDGDRHVRQRRLLNKGFSPRMIRAMETGSARWSPKSSTGSPGSRRATS